MNRPNRLAAVLLALAGLGVTSAAFAQYPGMVREADGVVIEQPGVVVGQPHMVRTAVTISLGWHGDRYYDGHRYWARDEWMHRHPHDRGPRGWHDDHGHRH